MLAGAGAVAALTSFDAKAAEPRVIKVHARKFTFTPNRLTLAPHEQVVFEVTAEDTVTGIGRA
jgi:cytochrome c oxidase subunit 2